MLVAPFPYFGGKRSVVDAVWARFGTPKQYIEPFCGSAAMLLAAPTAASLEVVSDANGFIANFWRAVSHQSQEVARWADYPVSHIDLGARHRWLLEQRERVGRELHDPSWPGDAKVAGWWLWGQCAWIGSGWCDWWRERPHEDGEGGGADSISQQPRTRGAIERSQIPFIGHSGMGILGKYRERTQASDFKAQNETPPPPSPPPLDYAAVQEGFWTSSGRLASHWLKQLADRLDRVRVLHGDWSRCLNHHYGGKNTAVFLDPPYENYESLYRCRTTSTAQEVAAWCRENAELKIALCGHKGDYDLPGWEVFEWTRKGLTFAGGGTRDQEAIWFSPACERVTEKASQIALF